MQTRGSFPTNRCTSYMMIRLCRITGNTISAQAEACGSGKSSRSVQAKVEDAPWRVCGSGKRTAFILSIILCATVVTPVMGQDKEEPGNTIPTSKTQLRIARSEDGKTFTDTGQVFLQHAAGADVIRLADGSLFVVVDYAREAGEQGDKNQRGRDNEQGDANTQSVLAVARSNDQGRTWSSLEPIELYGPGMRAIQPRHGDLEKLPGGWYRLFFATPAMVRHQGRLRQSSEITTIRSALTRNGTEYKLEPRSHNRLLFKHDVHPMASWIGNRFHMFASELHKGRGKKQLASQIQHLFSGDGKKFVRLAPSRVLDASFVGSLIMASSGARAFGSNKDGIVSFITDRGREWKREEGVRLKNGWDPAVVELKDRTFLMIYCREMNEDSRASSQLVTADEDWLFEQYALMAEDYGSDEFLDEEIEPDVDQLAAGDLESPDGVTDLTDEQPTQAVMPPYDWNEWDPFEMDGYVPLPDFERKINYLEWYEKYALDHPVENAYDIYSTYTPMVGDEPGSKPAWSKDNQLVKAKPLEGAAKPWDPAAHPEWEEDLQELEWFLDQYKQATLMDGYAMSVQLGLPSVDDTSDPDERNLLMGIMLPMLTPHRSMAKATISAAWRMDENGKVSPGKMLDAWETVFRGATHLESGATLIEDLVANAERRLVQENARYALKEGVFSNDQLSDALETLQRFDRTKEDPTQALRGEHAMALDMIQHVFSPPGSDGLPKLNKKRMEKVISWSEMDNVSVERLTRMGPDDAYATAEAFDTHYRELAQKMEIGYPEVRASDINAFEQQRIHTSPLTEMMMPALSRVYQFGARDESGRRATQLAKGRPRKINNPKLGPKHYFNDKDKHITLNPYLTDKQVIINIKQIINDRF